MDDRLDDGTDDDSGGFRGCFISSAQNASYIDFGKLPTKKFVWTELNFLLMTRVSIFHCLPGFKVLTRYLSRSLIETSWKDPKKKDPSRRPFLPSPSL